MSEWGDDGNEQEEDVEFWSDARTVNDHIIALVDARENMLEEHPDGGNYLQTALKVLKSMMKSKVIMSDKHTVGITLFGTKKTSDEAQLNENVYVFQELDVPGASRIKAVEAMCEEDFDFTDEDFSWYGSMSTKSLCPLKNAIWSCSQQFALKVKHSEDFKRIMIFTNDDDPFESDQAEEERVEQVAKDAAETGVEVQVFGMASKGRKFDMKSFYQKLVSADPEDGDDYNARLMDEEGGASSLQELMVRVRKREVKKRRLVRLPFTLVPSLGERAPGLPQLQSIVFDVQVFAMYHSAPKPSSIWLDVKTNKPVKVHSKLLSQDTGEELDEHDIRSYLEFGGERVYFTKQEMADMKSFGEAGLALIGFRAASSLRPDFNLMAPYFIYPDEERTIGSAKAFVSLHTVMLRKGLVGLAVLNRTIGAAPRLVALLPQAEEIEEGMQLRPPGMHLVFLPYADEVREITWADEVIVADEDQVLSAESLIKTLQLEGLDCHNFSNPVLQKHYAALQAIALKEAAIDWDDQKDDNTRPDTEGIDEVARDAAAVFREACGLTEASAEDGASKPKKRGRAEGAPPPAGKRAKAQDDGEIDWAAAVADGTIDRLTMPVMKEYLKSVGKPVGGKKGDLVDRIRGLFT